MCNHKIKIEQCTNTPAHWNKNGIGRLTWRVKYVWERYCTVTVSGYTLSKIGLGTKECVDVMSKP